MCGINGFNFNDETLIKTMNNSIKYRGPDAEGILAEQNVTLGHVRLSILDLSTAGTQPMEYCHAGKRAVIVFNGEIYNFEDIRASLEKKGYAFSSKTDTEVILASYLEYGFDCVKLFNGMWAFAIYDPQKQLLFCSRDRLGVKPFYYFFDQEKFIFSSELKAILSHKGLSINSAKNLNKEAVDLFFALGYIPSPLSIFKNTFKLEPRQNLVFHLASKKLSKWTYYCPPPYQPVYDFGELLEEGRKILKDAVRLRMIADVPIGAFLSGGLDSTTTVGTMKDFTELENLHTFSIGFEGKYDESDLIKIASGYFKTNHHHRYFKQTDFDEFIPQFVRIFDEPFADYSAFPSFRVSEIARQHVTVALSGDGGDEVFGGYPEYKMCYRLEFLKKIPRILRAMLANMPAKENLNGYTSLYLLKKACKTTLYDPSLFFANALEGDLVLSENYKDWTSTKLNASMKLSCKNFAEVLRLYDMMFNTLPDNYLMKVDKCSMAYALEVRSPFLDYRFIEFSQKIPVEWKVDFFKTKKFMRKLSSGIVPYEVLTHPKKPFIPPLKEWITDDKYAPFLKQSTTYIKDIAPDLYQFLNERVLEKNNVLYNRYKIRLFLYGKWFENWVINN